MSRHTGGAGMSHLSFHHVAVFVPFEQPFWVHY